MLELNPVHFIENTAVVEWGTTRPQGCQAVSAQAIVQLLRDGADAAAAAVELEVEAAAAAAHFLCLLSSSSSG